MSKTIVAILLASFGAADAVACDPVDSCPMLSDGLYCPVNNFTEHADINRDVAEIGSLLGEYPPNYAAAKTVYTDGQESSKGGGVMRILQEMAQQDMTASGKYTNTYYSGYVDLYGAYSDVWDRVIVDCLDGTGFCAGKSDNFRRNIINKGCIGVVGGYATYEMGAAVWKAEDGQLTDTGAPYAWDEAVAFYVGNLEPATATESRSPYSPYEVFRMRDADFPDGISTHTEAVPILNSGLDGVRGTYVAPTVADAQESMYKIMSIAAIRGAIEYSYRATLDEMHVAEGAMLWRFASGYIASVSSAVKTLVQEIDLIFDLETKGTLAADAPCTVKTKVEAMYADLGITCEMVGTWKDATDAGCDACDDGSATGELSAGSSDYADTCKGHCDVSTDDYACGLAASSPDGLGPDSAGVDAYGAVDCDAST